MIMPKSMLSTVQTTLGQGKEKKYMFSNNYFWDITDHRGQGNRKIITWDSFIARLVNQNNNSSILRLWDNSMGRRVREK